MARIAIIGAGPAGQFTAEELLAQGVAPEDITVFDGGPRVRARYCPMESPGCACETCAILEGEGGAGGFSDGKMTYSTRRGTQGLPVFSEAEYAEVIDRIRRRMEQLEARLGVPARREGHGETVVDNWKGTGLRFESYPLVHYGSDGIRRIVKEQVEETMALGVSYRFGEPVRSVSRAGARGFWLELSDGYEECQVLVVATGLSGTRWSEETLASLRVGLTPGPAGFGLRVEAPAEVLDPAFDEFYDFKLSDEDQQWQTRSFCCNRRGRVVNENHRGMGFVNVNGRSSLGVQSAFSNFAVITRIDSLADPCAFVRALAAQVNAVAGGTGVQPLSEFLTGTPGPMPEGTNMKAKRIDLRDTLPPSVWRCAAGFLQRACLALPGLRERGMIYGPEAKYYGYRVDVSPDWKVHGVPGLYVVGNASGYLDSHVACAASGIIAARHIARSLQGGTRCQES